LSIICNLFAELVSVKLRKVLGVSGEITGYEQLENGNQGEPANPGLLGKWLLKWHVFVRV